MFHSSIPNLRYMSVNDLNIREWYGGKPPIIKDEAYGYIKLYAFIYLVELYIGELHSKLYFRNLEESVNILRDILILYRKGEDIEGYIEFLKLKYNLR